MLGVPIVGSFKRCNCKRAKCLKLYCVCFAAGVYCSGCNCKDCTNTQEHQAVVMMERQRVLQRSPHAFDAKVEPQVAGITQHRKGCRCRKSKCLKKYCECFDAGVRCSAMCKCDDCHNAPDDSTAGDGSAAMDAMDDAGTMRTVMFHAPAGSGMAEPRPPLSMDQAAMEAAGSTDAACGLEDVPGAMQALLAGAMMPHHPMAFLPEAPDGVGLQDGLPSAPPPLGDVVLPSPLDLMAQLSTVMEPALDVPAPRAPPAADALAQEQSAAADATDARAAAPLPAAYPLLLTAALTASSGRAQLPAAGAERAVAAQGLDGDAAAEPAISGTAMAELMAQMVANPETLRAFSAQLGLTEHIQEAAVNAARFIKDILQLNEISLQGQPLPALAAANAEPTQQAPGSKDCGKSPFPTAASEDGSAIAKASRDSLAGSACRGAAAESSSDCDEQWGQPAFGLPGALARSGLAALAGRGRFLETGGGVVWLHRQGSCSQLESHEVLPPMSNPGSQQELPPSSSALPPVPQQARQHELHPSQLHNPCVLLLDAPAGSSGGRGALRLTHGRFRIPAATAAPGVVSPAVTAHAGGGVQRSTPPHDASPQLSASAAMSPADGTIQLQQPAGQPEAVAAAAEAAAAQSEQPDSDDWHDAPAAPELQPPRLHSHRDALASASQDTGKARKRANACGVLELHASELAGGGGGNRQSGKHRHKSTACAAMQDVPTDAAQEDDVLRALCALRRSGA